MNSFCRLLRKTARQNHIRTFIRKRVARQGVLFHGARQRHARLPRRQGRPGACGPRRRARGRRHDADPDAPGPRAAHGQKAG